MTNVQVFIYIVVPLLVLLFTFISAWLVYVMKTARSEVMALRNDLAVVIRKLNDVEILVAGKYATREEVDVRLDRLEQKLSKPSL